MEKENNKQSVIYKIEQAIARFSERSGTSNAYARVIFCLTYLSILPIILAGYTLFSMFPLVSLNTSLVFAGTMALVFLFIEIHQRFYPSSSIINVMLFFLLFHLTLKAFAPIFLAFIATL